jgi:hypothetical protein
MLPCAESEIVHGGFRLQQKTQKGRDVEEEKIRVVRPGATKSKGQGNQDWAAGLLIAIWEGSTKTQVQAETKSLGYFVRSDNEVSIDR